MAFLGIAAAIGIAFAQEPTLQEFTVAPVFRNGELQACALNFKSAQLDATYYEGQAIGVDGSANVYHFGQGRMSFMLKIGLVGPTAASPQAPSRSYLVKGYDTNAADSVADEPADSAGYKLSMFRLGDSTFEMIAGLLDGQSVSVGIQPAAGETAILVPLNLLEEERLALGECVRALLEDASSSPAGN